MQNVLTLKINKHNIKIENFEGPLDLLVHLIDKNKMNICDVNLSEITDQYIAYIKEFESANLEIASEFLVMASTLLYIKSKTILPNYNEQEDELSEEELLQRIIDYKKYKEITKKLKEMYNCNAVRYYKTAEEIQLPKQKIEKNYEATQISDIYEQIVERNLNKFNENAKNIEKIAITDTYTVASKVKEMLKELIKKPRFVFNALFSLQRCNKEEVVTAFSGLLELSRRNKVITEQPELFGDISVSKNKIKKIN